MPGNSELELVKLKARIADIDEELQKLKTTRLLSAGEKLLKQYAWQRERRKCEVEINLIHADHLIERLERDCNPPQLSKEFQQSPLGKSIAAGSRISAEKYQQMRLAGRALGAGSPGPWPRAKRIDSPRFGPDATAFLALTNERLRREAILQELAELRRNDPDEANGNAKSVPSPKPGRGRKPDPKMAQAGLDIRSVFACHRDASAKDVCDELTRQKKPCPYGDTWHDGFAKHPNAVKGLISKTKTAYERTLNITQPLQSKSV